MQVLAEKDRNDITSQGQDEYCMDDDYDDIFNSPSLEESFQHATLIVTLAERFNLKEYQ